MNDLRMINADRLDPDFVAALTKSVSRESAYPSFQENWSSENPFAGNCLVASLVTWWRYGGALMTGRVDQPENNWHFRNRLQDGTQVDLAWSQYGFDRIFHPFGPSDDQYRADMDAALRDDDTLHYRLDRLLENMSRNGAHIDASSEEIIHAAIAQSDAIHQRMAFNKQVFAGIIPPPNA